ncbi:MAG: hypothetical protein V1855_03820, partial [bacterium]
ALERKNLAKMKEQLKYRKIEQNKEVVVATNKGIAKPVGKMPVVQEVQDSEEEEEQPEMVEDEE